MKIMIATAFVLLTGATSFADNLVCNLGRINEISGRRVYAPEYHVQCMNLSDYNVTSFINSAQKNDCTTARRNGGPIYGNDMVDYLLGNGDYAVGGKERGFYEDSVMIDCSLNAGAVTCAEVGIALTPWETIRKKCFN